MHPQAVIVDSSAAEDTLFLWSIREEAATLGIAKAVIELPEQAEERLAWITKLDASALSAWNRVSVDILIHAHTDASGSLIRLLKSLAMADFTSCAVPHLTIELPESIDPPTTEFLRQFQWPPQGARNPSSTNKVTLRHRISRRGVTEEESSVRFLESFWPVNPTYSHVLVLSPQVELSPTFFHYLKLTLLEYRYSGQALYQAWDQRLFSISLELPSSRLDGSGPLTPPSSVLSAAGEPIIRTPDTSTPFLWQAPNSNAALFTGEKWAELHGFVSQLLDVSQAASAALAQKAVSKEYPAWMEHSLRLCRARGYWSLYPSREMATSLATIHDELFQQPEEYEHDSLTKHEDEDEVVIRRESVLDSLPSGGELLKFDDMPLLAWDAVGVSLEQLDEASVAYASDFKRTVGGCVVDVAARPDPSARDLFCTSDDDM